MNIIIITNNGIEETFSNKDYNNIFLRNDIKYLEINNYNKNNIEINKSVEILKMINCSLTDFPKLNSNKLTNIFIKTSKISKIPDLSNLIDLEELTIEDSYIDQINYPFPKNIKNINLTYNQLKDDIFDNLSFYPNDLVEFDIGYNFITKFPPSEIIKKVKYYNNNIETKKIFIQIIEDEVNMWNRQYNNQLDDRVNIQFNNYNGIINNINNQENMFNTSQTVHISSINDSASKSIIKILELTKNYPIEENFENDLLYNMYGNIIIRYIFYSNKIIRINFMLNDRSIHSNTKITYKKLLERIWQLIKNHEMKNDLIDRLKTEIEDSFGYCFTGRINRLINSLTGFIDDIGITISVKEEVQNEINLVIKKFVEKTVNKEEALKEFEKIFEGRYLEENYKKSWIEALEDYD